MTRAHERLPASQADLPGYGGRCLGPCRSAPALQPKLDVRVAPCIPGLKPKSSDLHRSAFARCWLSIRETADKRSGRAFRPSPIIEADQSDRCKVAYLRADIGHVRHG